MTERRAAEAPVGVFDSGVGVLTVLAVLTQTLPGEDFVYLGDTARLPYGTRSADSVLGVLEPARIGATLLGRRPEASDIKIVDLATGTPILRS